MKYDLVWLNERRAAGLVRRMSNSDADLVPVIGGMWQKFFTETIRQIPLRQGGSLFGIYSNYESDCTGKYDLTVCGEVESAVDALSGGVPAGGSDVPDTRPLPEGISAVTIPAGMYARFVFHGDMRQGTGAFWSEVWKTELNRKYTFDFEEYIASADSSSAEIYIYIAVNDVCQSCGMPLSEPAHYAVNPDGTPNTDYCSYCYADGHFTDTMTMREMADFCAPTLVKEGICPDESAARNMMLSYFPTLKRWKNA